MTMQSLEVGFGRTQLSLTMQTNEKRKNCIWTKCFFSFDKYEIAPKVNKNTLASALTNTLAYYRLLHLCMRLHYGHTRQKVHTHTQRTDMTRWQQHSVTYFIACIWTCSTCFMWACVWVYVGEILYTTYLGMPIPMDFRKFALEIFWFQEFCFLKQEKMLRD